MVPIQQLELIAFTRSNMLLLLNRLNMLLPTILVPTTATRRRVDGGNPVKNPFFTETIVNHVIQKERQK